MYCKKCGRELEANAKFCRYCGEKIFEQSVKQKQKDKKFSSKKLWLLAIGAIALGVLVFIFNLKDNINLEKYVKAEFYGYDTVGTGYFYIDNADIPEGLWNSIYLTPDYSENLSNGDELVISIHYDNGIAKDYDIKFSGEQVKVEVDGLTELIEINPFDGFSFEPYGTSPFGMAEFSYNGNNGYIKAEDFYYYNIDDEMNLRNGDTVTIEYMNPLNPAEYGYKITEKFKDYTVEGLDEYVESFDDLPESFLSYAKEEAVDSITSYTAKEYYSGFVGMSPLEYAGYIYKVKKSSASGEYNVLYLIYKSKLSHSLGDFDEQYIYYPVKYSDIICVNGQISAKEQGIEGYTREPYETDGYRVPTQSYMELATESQDIYNVTAGDGFEIYEKNNFIYSVSDISDEIWQILESRAVSAVNKYLAEGDEFRWYTESQATMVGGYLLVAKNQTDLKEANNELIIVYSSTISNENESSLLYLPVIFEDLQIFPNGDFAYLEKQITTNHCGINYWLANHTKGYIDESEMYNDLVKQYMDSYNEEVYGNLQTY